MNLRKAFLKPLASFLKRYYIATNDGYSVGKAYGARFLFDWRHTLDKKVALELYEHDQINYLVTMAGRIKPDMFLDIGSHAALYSVVMKTHFPGVEIHAFEPDRTNLCQLYANLFVNRLQSDIQVHEHGISDKEGTVSFDTSEETSSRGTRRISAEGNTVIQVKRLDNVRHDKDRVVVIKIDVEGHECHVIDGASTFLASNHCFLQIESSGDNLRQLKEQMTDMGYRSVASLNDHFFTNIDRPLSVD